MPAPEVSLALDPSLPETVTRILRANPHILIEVRRGRAPAPPGIARPVLACVGVIGLALLIVAGPLGLVAFLGMICGGSVLYFAMSDPKERAYQRRLRVVFDHADRFVLPEDLDETCGALLGRAQRAVLTVLGSTVNREGLLDTFDNAITLPDQEWQLARRLMGLSKLRTEHHKVVGDDVPEEFADAFRPYDAALETATASVTARVEALERYAEQAHNADRYYHARRKLGILQERTHEYEQLLAETAHDDTAVPQIERMSGNAQAVEQVFRHSIDEARKAANHLLAVDAA
ncbi:hypothetical protein J5X84_18145 [Streptosporangiaceae bacterium NEAU-GS5]|nr:hypothetical protein [Streptosporangiaceae bacterium NEAU-GS5]